jgi:serine protease Do
MARISSVTEGIVSAVGRDLGNGSGPVWLQHQSAINQANSGGPLLDMEGNVVGVKDEIEMWQGLAECGARLRTGADSAARIGGLRRPSRC